MKKILQFLLEYLEDFLIFMGLITILGATFALNIIAGVYLLGFIFLILGVYFAKFPPKGR
jgi:hypothetical protein